MEQCVDVIAELVTDHAEATALLDVIAATPAGDPARKRLTDELTVELVRHSVAERNFLHPALRLHLPDGADIAHEETAEHLRLLGVLKELEGMEAGAPGFDPLIHRLRREVSAHTGRVETAIFPMLRATCAAQVLENLGARVRRAKHYAPTRAHPGVPNTPPAGVLLVSGTGLVDRTLGVLSGPGGS
ncbi:hemerythrin domain-containing protein [Streptomyces sp. NPDC018031]|uniref:hemerythrin domain-containing protein n=1 Tax=Streptomyces sp. NPDC018031 TaxID=3365033 RepID=UPI0037BC0ED1